MVAIHSVRWSLIAVLVASWNLAGPDLASAALTVRVGTLPGPPVELVNHTNIWRFRRGRTEPPSNWASVPDADLDASWESGRGGIGYADGDDGTTLSDMQNQYTTVYIRRSFTADAAVYSNRVLHLIMDWDDGFVAYLNGVEVARSANAAGAGTPPPFDATLPVDHPASVDSGQPAEVFDLGPARDWLLPGTNILALQGINGTIDSSDLTLNADLDLVDVSGGGSLTDGLFALVKDAAVQLTGTNSFPGSSVVTVNGEEAILNAVEGTWTKSAVLQPGMNELFVAALDPNGGILASTNLDLVYEAASTPVGGLITANTAWTKPMGTIRVTTDAHVANGAELTIGEGVVVLFSPGVSLQAWTNSTITVAGSEAEPVYLLPADGHTAWGELSARGAGASLSLTQGNLAAGQLRILTNATVTVEDSVLREMYSRLLVDGRYGQQLTFRRTHFNRYAQIHIDYTPTLVEDCLLENITSDAMDFLGNPAEILIRRCTWRYGFGGNTDAIDLGSNLGVLVEDCLIHDFPDKAVSIADNSHSTTVRNTLIYNTGSGLNVYAASNAVFDHVTVADSGYGIRLYVRAGFTGPGHGSGTNLISWNNQVPLEVTNDAVFALSYSDIQGAAAYPGTGNLNSDPQFVDALSRDYRLSPGSPAQGTGLDGSDMGVQLPVGGIPSAPFNLAATATPSNAISLSWEEDADNEAGFLIVRSLDQANWIEAGATPANTTSYLDGDLDEGQQYYYRVRATNTSGVSRLSNLALASTLPPAVPETIVGGTLAANATWTTNLGRILVLSTVVVPQGVTLTIREGAHLFLTNGASLRATNGGSIEIAGTADRKVVLERLVAGGLWGELSARGTDSTLTVRHADISGGQTTVYNGATGLFEDSYFHDYVNSGGTIFTSPLMLTYYPQATVVRRCHFNDYYETLFRDGVVTIEYCLFENMVGDAVDFDAAHAGTILRQSTFRHGDRGNVDAVDVGNDGANVSRGVVIESCDMHDFPFDKGVSIGEEAQGIIVRNCLMYRVARGVQVKDVSTASLYNNTIVEAEFAIHGYEKFAGTGAGHPTNTYNNILWANTNSIEIEATTVISVHHSDTGGADWAGLGNINADPLFRNPLERDYRLLPGSPCLGTGQDGVDMGVAFPVGGVPAPPAGLQLISLESSRAVLAWQDPGDVESGFVLEHSDDNLTWCACATAPANATSGELTGDFTAPAHYFRVRATNFIGASFASEIVSTGSDPDDLDGDGMPNDWETVHGFNPNDPADALLDADEDGQSNVDEYGAGTDPHNPASRLAIESLVVTGLGELDLSFTALADRVYTVEFRDSLAHGAWQTLSTVPAAPFDRIFMVNDSLPPTVKVRFYRITTLPTPR